MLLQQLDIDISTRYNAAFFTVWELILDLYMFDIFISFNFNFCFSYLWLKVVNFTEQGTFYFLYSNKIRTIQQGQRSTAVQKSSRPKTGKIIFPYWCGTNLFCTIILKTPIGIDWSQKVWIFIILGKFWGGNLLFLPLYVYPEGSLPGQLVPTYIH